GSNTRAGLRSGYGELPYVSLMRAATVLMSAQWQHGPAASILARKDRRSVSDASILLVLAGCAGCAWLLLRLCAALLPARREALPGVGADGAYPAARIRSAP